MTATFTVAQLACLIQLLGEGDVEQNIKMIFAAETEKLKSISERQLFSRAMMVVDKAADPLEIMVTRPRSKCKYRHRPDEYQIRVWRKGSATSTEEATYRKVGPPVDTNSWRNCT